MLKPLTLTVLLATALLPAVAPSASAQVPVFDEATFAKAQATARNTLDILDASRDTLDVTRRTLEAVTGERQDGTSFRDIALGSGFSIGQAPSIADIFEGGTLSFGSIDPEIARVATTLINGMQLLQELRTYSEGVESAGNRNYTQAVSRAAQLAALVAGAQDASRARTQALTQAAGQVGQASDLKGALDQNTMLQVQQGLTTNELIGTMNGALTALQQQTLDELVAQSGAAEIMRTDPNHDPFASGSSR